MRAVVMGAVAAVTLAAGGASAAVVTIGFEESGLECGYYPEDRSGNVTWDDYNRCTYQDEEPDITLGDDGWTSFTQFTADLGTTFTPLAFDVLSAWLSLERAADQLGFDWEC